MLKPQILGQSAGTDDTRLEQFRPSLAEQLHLPPVDLHNLAQLVKGLVVNVLVNDLQEFLAGPVRAGKASLDDLVAGSHGDARQTGSNGPEPVARLAQQTRIEFDSVRGGLVVLWLLRNKAIEGRSEGAAGSFGQTGDRLTAHVPITMARKQAADVAQLPIVLVPLRLAQTRPDKAQQGPDTFQALAGLVHPELGTIGVQRFANAIQLLQRYPAHTLIERFVEFELVWHGGP